MEKHKKQGGWHQQIEKAFEECPHAPTCFECPLKDCKMPSGKFYNEINTDFKQEE